MLCKYHKVTLKELSNKVSYSDYRVNDIVANKPVRITDQEVEEIANYFQVPVDTLLNKKAHLEFK